MGPLLFSSLASSLACAQTAPREKPSDYPDHQKVASMELAAEYLVHSIPGPRGVIFAQDYLIVDVAAFPLSKAGASWKTDQFTLRINEKKVLLAQAPQMVSTSLNHADFQQRRQVVGEAGAGNGSVIFGQPTNPGHFPGDPNRTRQPPVIVPEENRNGQDPEQAMPVEEICIRMALQEGEFRGPVHGLLYFPYVGKLKSIHSLELLYEAPGGGKATLSLF